MFEHLHPLVTPFTKAHHARMMAFDARESRTVMEMLAQAQCHECLFSLDLEVGQNGSEKCLALLTGSHPAEEGTPVGMVTTLKVEVSTELSVDGTDGTRIGHVDANKQLVADMVAEPLSVDGDITLSVKEPSEIGGVHTNLPQAAVRMVAKSGNIQTGQPRTKQALITTLGARNESVPPAKAKGDSDLTRNRESLSEMYRPMWNTFYHMSNNIAPISTRSRRFTETTTSA